MVLVEGRDEEETKFLEYLYAYGLSDTTIREYMIRFRKFPKNELLTDRLVYQFIDQHKNSVSRAFVSLYLKYKGVRDIIVPTIRGAKRSRVINLISEQDFKILKKALYERNIKWGLMFELTYYCALRREEVVNIEPSWIDLESYKKDTLRIKVIGKRNKQRIIVVPSDVSKVLVNYLLDKFKTYGLGDHDKLFSCGVHRWWKVLTDMSIRILNKKYKPHELRHSRATMWLEQGKDLLTIKERLGHSSLSTTERYTHITQEQVAKNWEEESN